MHSIKKALALFAALASVLALTAVSASSAFGAVAEILPGSGSFTGTSGKGTLTTKAKGTVECTKNSDSGALSSTTSGTFKIVFTGCTVFGFIEGKSLGAKSGEIITEGTFKPCYTATSPLAAGILLSPNPVHLEAGGKLIVVKGTVVGAVTPINKSQKEAKLVFEQSGASQKIKNCVNEKGVSEGEDKLEAGENNEKFEAAAEATEATITWAANHEIMA